MKFFSIERDKQRNKTNFRFLGYRILSISKSDKKYKRQIATMQKEINNLHNLMNYAIDIRSIPVATGKIRNIQLKSSKILEKIDIICKKHNIKYWIDFGTLLGAVRHKGFVPWDDDIDICLLRDDYEKLREILKSNFLNTDISVREVGFINHFQIRVSQDDNLVGIDIFPVDKYFTSKISEEEKICLNERIKKAQELLKERCLKNDNFKNDINAVKEYIKHLNKDVIQCGTLDNVDTPLLYYGIDWAHTYKNNTIKFNTIFPLSEITFEGKKFPCPNRVEEHLSNLYGKYNCFPKCIYREV